MQKQKTSFNSFVVSGSERVYTTQNTKQYSLEKSSFDAQCSGTGTNVNDDTWITCTEKHMVSKLVYSEKHEIINKRGYWVLRSVNGLPGLCPNQGIVSQHSIWMRCYWFCFAFWIHAIAQLRFAKQWLNEFPFLQTPF